MNKTTKIRILTVIFCSVLITLAVASLLLSNPVNRITYASTVTSETNTMKLKIDSYTTIKDSEGKVKFYSEHPAILTTNGKDFVKVCLGVNASCGVPTAFDFIAVGGNTSAMSSADTTLANEVSGNGLARAFGTYGSTGTGAWRIEKDFSVTGTQNNINSTGLFNASSSGTMLAEDTISNTNVVNGDTLNITWTVSVS